MSHEKRYPLNPFFIFVISVIFFSAFTSFQSLSVAEASTKFDVRLALLVGNQYGWQREPQLRYALRGDLRPFARILRRLGFEVKTLENGRDEDLRRAFAWIKRRLQQKPKVSTFLFYYTGHADKKYLHLGRRGSHPVSYKELMLFLKNLKVRRRFVLLDSCFSGELIRKFGSLEKYRELLPKGARAQRTIDLSRSIPNQGDEKSLLVISSGIALSWESQRYRASIFTHHLLRGLKGAADRDLDGRISMAELFDYVSDSMQRDIREKPQLFGVIQRSQTYALAPAYSSRLWISPNVFGELRVSVANFIWLWKKRRHRALRLALIHGLGRVQLKRDGLCWHQLIRLPKGREIKLGQHWRRVPCRHLKRLSKGLIPLPAQLEEPLHPERHHVQLGAHTGVLNTHFTSTGLMFWGLGFDLQSSFWRVSFDFWSTSNQINAQNYNHLFLQTNLDLGYRFSWKDLSFFAGPSLGIGLFIQDINEEPSSGPLFSYGLLFASRWRFNPSWSLALRTKVGFLLGNFGQRWLHKFAWHLSAGLLWHF